MNYRLIGVLLLFLTSCTAAKLSVPDEFSSQATKMHVQGLNGWMVNQRLTFGKYSTSVIKRGWDFNSSLQYTKFNLKPEEMLLRVYNIDTDNRSVNQRNKFQYTIQDGNLVSEIFATEKFTEKQLVYKSNNPYLGDATKTNSYHYAFSAAILPLTPKDNDPWSLVLVNKYNANADVNRNLLDGPNVEETGYATNGKEKVMIRTLRIDNVTTKSGKETKVFGGEMLTGYELRWDDGVVGIIDIMDNNIWLANNLDDHDRLILSSISSAILLKRMQDVEKDKDNL